MTFRTVYELSVLNSTVLQGLFLFLLGMLFGGLGLKTEKGAKRILIGMWALAWCSITGIWFFGSLRLSYLYVQMLRNQKTDVAEGVVRVEHVQPAKGHAAGDRIRIGNEAFEIDYYTVKVGYTQSISHGGSLVDGAFARVHYRGGNILKVEIGQ